MTTIPQLFLFDHMLLKLTSFSIQSCHNLTLQNPMERVGTILLKIDRVLAPEETL